MMQKRNWIFTERKFVIFKRKYRLLQLDDDSIEAISIIKKPCTEKILFAVNIRKGSGQALSQGVYEAIDIHRNAYRLTFDMLPFDTRERKASSSCVIGIDPETGKDLADDLERFLKP